VSSAGEPPLASSATTTCAMDKLALEELHRHKQFRAVVKPSMIGAALHLSFNCLGPQPTNVREYEHNIWLVIGASNVVAILIYGYTFMVAEDKRAHSALVWLNELNAIATCVVIAWCGQWYDEAVDAMESHWAMAQVCFFLASISVQMNLCGYPVASRVRICSTCLLTCYYHPSWTPCSKTEETTIFTLTMLTGDLLGYVFNRALRSMFVAQAERMEQLECEKQRIEYELRFSERRLVPPKASRSDGSLIASTESGSSSNGLPCHIAAGPIANGLLVDSGTSRTSSAVVGAAFTLEGGETLEPAHLSRCGASTVGSNSEVGNILDLYEYAPVEPPVSAGGLQSLVQSAREAGHDLMQSAREAGHDLMQSAREAGRERQAPPHVVEALPASTHARFVATGDPIARSLRLRAGRIASEADVSGFNQFAHGRDIYEGSSYEG